MNVAVLVAQIPDPAGPTKLDPGAKKIWVGDVHNVMPKVIGVLPSRS